MAKPRKQGGEDGVAVEKTHQVLAVADAWCKRSRALCFVSHIQPSAVLSLPPVSLSPVEYGSVTMTTEACWLPANSFFNSGNSPAGCAHRNYLSLKKKKEEAVLPFPHLSALPSKCLAHCAMGATELLCLVRVSKSYSMEEMRERQRLDFL